MSTITDADIIAEWKADPQLRKDFADDFVAFHAYRRAQARSAFTTHNTRGCTRPSHDKSENS